MNRTKSNKTDVRKLPLAGILTATVIILQLIANYIQPVPGVSVTLVLVPVIIGAALLGPYVGAWLGLVFGFTVFLTGGANAFLAISVPGTVITCLLKGLCAGLAVSAVYRLLEKRNEYFAIICAAIACPIVNTGLFLAGCRIFFWQVIQAWGTAVGFENTLSYMIFGLAGINFVIELAVNCVLAPVLLRLIRVGKGMMHRR